MPKRLPVTTPQFKLQLVRKLTNLFPNCSVEFLDAERGLRFRLKDAHGRYYSDVAQLHRHTDGVLTRSSLLRLVRLTRGSPQAPMPRRSRSKGLPTF
jgi:hypothetical protein